MNRGFQILLVSLLALFSCRENEITDTKFEEKHLKYFGFALTDYVQDRLPEIDEFVNLVDLSLEDLGSTRAKLMSMTDGNNFAIIHLQGIFFRAEPDSLSPTGIRYKLNDNYAELFNAWYSNNSNLPTDKIVAFTVADEPAWNLTEMEELHTAATTVKLKFPDVNILVVEGPLSIDQLILSDDIDWVGFDRYGTIDPNNDTEYLQAMELLKSKRTSEDQKIVVIMESQWLTYYEEAGFSQSVLRPMAASYYEYAQRDEDVVALISYLLPSGFDVEDQKGFFDLQPEIQQAFREIGSKIVDQ